MFLWTFFYELQLCQVYCTARSCPYLFLDSSTISPDHFPAHQLGYNLGSAHSTYYISGLTVGGLSSLLHRGGAITDYMLDVFIRHVVSSGIVRENYFLKVVRSVISCSHGSIMNACLSVSAKRSLLFGYVLEASRSFCGNFSCLVADLQRFVINNS